MAAITYFDPVIEVCITSFNADGERIAQRVVKWNPDHSGDSLPDDIYAADGSLTTYEWL